MEFLGYACEPPTLNENRKWNYVEIECPDDYVFNDTTSKIFKSIKNDNCKFIVADPENNRFFIELLDVRYNTEEKTIRIWPHNAWLVKK